MLLGTDSPIAPFDILRGRWIDPNNPDALEAAVAAETAQRFGVDVGETLLVGQKEKSQRLRIVGIVDTPTISVLSGRMAASQVLTPSLGELFVPTGLAERIVGRTPLISFVAISLKPETDITRFRFGWAPRLSRFAVPVQFQEAHDIEEALDETASAENVQIQAYAATGISLLVALLVIFSTLNMGVSERIRQLAVLRAVVLTRAQVGMLVAIESLLLATIGFFGGIGLGQLLLWCTGEVSSKLLHHGAEIGTNSVFLAVISAYGGAFLAAIIPAYRATRIRPVDAMAWQARPSFTRKLSLPVSLTGVGLILLNPLLTFVFPPSFETGVLACMAIGFGALAAGFVLLAPGVVVFTDRLLGPILARLLGIEPKLVASQITHNLWRTAGAALSMTIGLGLYIAIQVWGFTMLDAFIPGSWAPDALISFNPAGIPPEKAVAVAELPGVDPKRCLPIVVEQPRLLEDLTHSAERASVVRQDNVVLVGLPAGPALGGDHPLLELDWVQGSPEQAVRLLEKGRGCVVPNHFLRETGLKVGDAFALVPPEDSDHPVHYTIAGSVRLPGWHWQTKHTGLRPRTHRAAALVFADYSFVARDFDLDTASHVWLSYNSDRVDPQRLAAGAESLYSDILQRDVTIDSPLDDGPYIRVMPVDDIRRSTRHAAKRWIWVIGQLPLVALIIACFGVLNVILASVQARRWDMGVLRAIGFGRWALVRAVLAEGLLIGLVACLLSLGFGIIAGWCGCEIAQYISFFGGMHPSLVVPWAPIVVGLVAALVLSACAALWPAFSIGGAHPLTLLQQGRGAF
jgi:putative ABC transport system permease protein